MKLSKTLLAIACFALVGVGLMPPASAYTIEEVYNGTYSLNVSVDSFSFAKKRCIKWKTKTPYLDGGQSFGSSWYNSDVDNCPDGMIRLDGPQQGHKSSLRGNSLFFEMQYSISRVAVYRNDEALRVFRTYLKTDGYTQKIKEFNIPSRAGYSYTSSAGKTYVLTHFFVYDNQFILYDPVSRFSLSFLGERVIENGIILANPGSDTDNLRMINLQKKKAWSMTTTATNAYKWLMGQDVSNKRIQSLEWNTSYSIIDGGNSFLPPQFFNDKQGDAGGLGFIYNEDLNFIAPSWQSESNNSDPLSTGSIVKKYNNCSEYWTDIKSLAIYSERCGNDASDDTTSNWVKVDSWNGEGDVIATLEEGGNKNKCGRFANAKKKYKEKYKDNFDSFYSDFSNYSFSSDALNVDVMCKGVELDQEHGSAPSKGFKRFFTTGTKEFLKALGGISSNFFSGIEVNSGKYLDQNSFEKDIGNYISYYKACQDGRFLPTPYDSWISSIIPYFQNKDNVCRYSEELKIKLDKKYSSYVFGESYRLKAFNDLGFSIFDKNGKLNLTENSSGFSNVPSVFDGFESGSLGFENVLDFFRGEYKKSYDKAYNLFGNTNCGDGIGSDKRDLLIYFPVFLLFWYIIKGKF